ncbi:MAG: hypothetical protein KBG15_01355 [Kofleriaceae bacterium]|nr:hypothetical protein [Kofleriaceae bacterium]
MGAPVAFSRVNNHNYEVKHIARISFLVVLIGTGIISCGAKKPTPATPAATVPATTDSSSTTANDESAPQSSPAAPPETQADPDDGGEVSPK